MSSLEHAFGNNEVYGIYVDILHLPTGNQTWQRKSPISLNMIYPFEQDFPRLITREYTENPPSFTYQRTLPRLSEGIPIANQ